MRAFIEWTTYIVAICLCPCPCYIGFGFGFRIPVRTERAERLRRIEVQIERGFDKESADDVVHIHDVTLPYYRPFV